MVFCVEKFSALLASCCNVEVVKGRGAFLTLSPFFTSVTLKEAPSRLVSRASICSLLCISALWLPSP
mgnify:CR=1 FL=1